MTGVVNNFRQTVVISGSDINVGDYTSVTYPEEFSGAVNVSGSQTIASAFQTVETTISALTKELIDDLEVTQAAIQALASGAGLANNDIIQYEPLTTGYYISGATSLYDADKKLDAAIKTLEGSIATSVKIDPNDDLNRLLKVTNDGIAFTQSPLFDCGVF